MNTLCGVFRSSILFRELISSVTPGDWVVIDEVQRIPSLLNEVHRLVAERDLRFALLGSSARKLKTAGAGTSASETLFGGPWPGASRETPVRTRVNRGTRQARDYLTCNQGQ